MTWLPAKERRMLAYKALNLNPTQVRSVPQITPQIRILMARLKQRNLSPSPIFYLKGSSSKIARQLCDLYYSLPRDQRDQLPLEAYCVRLDVSPPHVFDIILEATDRVSRAAAEIEALVTHPEAVHKTIERALDDDREDAAVYMGMLHKHSGFLPAGKGTQINVNTSANAAATAQSAVIIPAPPPEQTIRRAIDRFNEALGPTRQAALPPSSAVPAPEFQSQGERAFAAAIQSEEEEDEMSG